MAVNPFINDTAIPHLSNMVLAQATLQKLFAISQISIELINQHRMFNVDQSQLQILANLIADFNGSKITTNECLPKLNNVDAQCSQLVFATAGSAPLTSTTITPGLKLTTSATPTNMALIKQISPKEYPCTICNLKFKTAYNRNRHAKIHNGIKAYRCDYSGCKQEFSYYDHMMRHKRGTHENVRPFICTVCNVQTFNRKSNLLRHMSTQHGILKAE